ncbi:MAG: M1 family metallopeptidase [Gemmatimonadetes bacterium]|nr:M1 family metallopeptidase [Gemmatimonadota bacterium]
MTSISAVARRVSCIAVALALPNVASAQTSAATSSLPTPRALKEAYAKGTRSPDGRPGARYWQNHGRYTITLTTSPPNRNVSGTEQIVYVNNSPDTLARLAMRIIANIHKPGAYRETNANPDYLTSGVHIDRFTVNGQPATWNAENGFTVQGVTLPAPLMPHDSVRLGVDWHYDMSKESGREGAIDSTTFFLAYAYPRVSVYDDVNGWDRAPFNERLEFYSDFNDYDVTVKVPANFVVWGTGTLRNASDVLQPEILKRYQTSLTSPTTIRVATIDDMRARRVTAQQPVNAWHFTATNVPDAAFATSDHYVWDASSVSVADGRPRVSTQAAYNDTASDYRNVARYAAHALDWLSREWPGVPYPYEKTTVVEGPAGMEYPMMANDESYADTLFSRFVAEHEIAHSYFPFYMGIDETRYPFMDEGMTTATEYLLNVTNMGKAKADSFFRAFRVVGWVEDRSAESDEPIITPKSTGDNGYGKPALGYLALKELLGDARYRKALHQYMDEWHGKHPLPWDYFNTFNRATGENLDWFWRSWFFEPNYIDIGISGVTTSGSGSTVTLANIGGMPAPVDLVVRYADGTSETLHQTPAIWRTDLRRATVTIASSKKPQSIQLEHGIWMDTDQKNDRWSATHP